MSIVTAIYNAPIVRSSYLRYWGKTRITIKYNGKIYKGYANLHIDDDGFFSEKVGKNIALSKARIKAMKAELKREEITWRTNHNFFSEVVSHGGNPINFDNDFGQACIKHLSNSVKRIENLRAAIKREEHNLAKYIEGQARAIESVKRMRNKAKDD